MCLPLSNLIIFYHPLRFSCHKTPYCIYSWNAVHDINQHRYSSMLYHLYFINIFQSSVILLINILYIVLYSALSYCFWILSLKSCHVSNPLIRSHHTFAVVLKHFLAATNVSKDTHVTIPLNWLIFISDAVTGKLQWSTVRSLLRPLVTISPMQIVSLLLSLFSALTFLLHYLQHYLYQLITFSLLGPLIIVLLPLQVQQFNLRIHHYVYLLHYFRFLFLRYV